MDGVDTAGLAVSFPQLARIQPIIGRRHRVGDDYTATCGDRDPRHAMSQQIHGIAEYTQPAHATLKHVCTDTELPHCPGRSTDVVRKAFGSTPQESQHTGGTDLSGVITLAAIDNDRMLLEGLRSWLASQPDLDLVRTSATVPEYQPRLSSQEQAVLVAYATGSTLQAAARRAGGSPMAPPASTCSG